MAMQIQLIRYFLHIARLENFTLAAQELHIAQPALSKQISRLEKELGVELFERTGRGIRLTTAGKMLVFHGERMLSEWEKAAHGMKELELNGKSYIRLAVFPTFMWYVMPHFLPEFVKSHPYLHLEMEHGLNEPVLDWVLGHKMEAGIVTAPVSHPHLKEYPLLMEQFGLLVPAGHPWFEREELHFSDLHQHPLILSTMSRWYEDFILPVFKRFHVQPKVQLVVHNHDVIRELVRSGSGVSLIPLNAYRWWKSMDKNIDTQLKILVMKPTLQRQMLWIERDDRTRSPACETFYDALLGYLDVWNNSRSTSIEA